MREIRVLALAAGAGLIGLLLLSPPGSHADRGAYVVVSGDTLSEIAERHGVTVEELAEENGIVDPDLILSGQVLVIPSAGGASQVERAAGGALYTVQLGDALSEIAERFGVPAGAIAGVNGLSDPDLIVEGRVLVIPYVESALVRPVSPELEALMERFAGEEGIDPGLVKAVAYLESGWNQNVVSAGGAAGIMQIEPSTGAWLESEVFGYDLNIETSAYDNIRAGVRYLGILLDVTGDTDQAVAAYYQGHGALSLGILYEDTIQYVANVNAIRERFWA